MQKSKAGSHQKQGWEKFTSTVIDVVDRYGGANLGDKGGFGAGRGRGIVFLAWGAWAIQCVSELDKVSCAHTSNSDGLPVLTPRIMGHCAYRRSISS